MASSSLSLSLSGHWRQARAVKSLSLLRNDLNVSSGTLNLTQPIKTLTGWTYCYPFWWPNDSVKVLCEPMASQDWTWHNISSSGLNTSKSEECGKHQRHSNGQRKDVVTNEYDGSSKSLSSGTSSYTHANTLYNHQQHNVLASIAHSLRDAASPTKVSADRSYTWTLMYYTSYYQLHLTTINTHVVYHSSFHIWILYRYGCYFALFRVRRFT